MNIVSLSTVSTKRLPVVKITRKCYYIVYSQQQWHVKRNDILNVVCSMLQILRSSPKKWKKLEEIGSYHRVLARSLEKKTHLQLVMCLFCRNIFSVKNMWMALRYFGKHSKHLWPLKVDHLYFFQNRKHLLMLMLNKIFLFFAHVQLKGIYQFYGLKPNINLFCFI